MLRIENLGPVVSLEQGRRLLGVFPPPLTVRCYAIDGLLIDTGLFSHRRAVLDLAQAEGIRRAVITHHHEDHSNNASLLKDAGYEVLASNVTKDILERGFHTHFYQWLVWGTGRRAQVNTVEGHLETEHHRFHIYPAPGHCDDQIVLHEPNEGWLFTGDAFLADRVKLFRRDESFEKTVASLERLAQLDFDALYCAHRPTIEGGHAALERKLDRMRTLEGEVRRLHAKGLPLSEISRRTLGPDRGLLQLITWGDISKKNVIRSIIHGPTPRPR